MTGWHERMAFPARPAMIRTAILLAAVVALSPSGTASGAETFPYVGVVTQETVDIRAGGGESFYAVGSLEQGQLVDVYGHFYGWFKIRPPEDVFSYIKRAFVNRHGDGNVGTVSDEKAMVWAAEANGTPGASFRQQRYLKEGERVIIVEQSGDFYRITPPSDTYVFLPPESIAVATSEQIQNAASGGPSVAVTTKSDGGNDIAPAVEAASEGSALVEEIQESTVAEGKATPEPNVEPTVEVVSDVQSAAIPEDVEEEPQVAADTAPPSEVPAVVNPAHTMEQGRAPQVEAVEMRLKAVSELPLGDQPIDALIATYQDLQDDSELSRQDRNLVTMRLKQLNNRQRLAATLRSVSEFRSDLKRRASNASDVYEAQMKSGYAAVGRLLTSIVYNGEALPVMYRVVEPGTSRTLAYVRPATKSQATRLLGHLVGVVGRSRYDTALKAQVVDAERLEILEPTMGEQSRGNDAAGAMVLAPVEMKAR